MYPETALKSMTSLSAPLPKLLSDKAKPTGLAQLPPPSPRLASPISPSRRPQQQTPSIAHPIGNDGTSLAFGGIRPPQNTPADGMLPISASKIQGSRRLIGQVGNGRGRGSLSHAITPGNTPSSLDRITRRIASNLLLDGQNQAPTQQKVQGRIAPSYE